MRLSITGTRRPLSGTVRVPNSKYHAHRALILASLAPGTSTVVGLTQAKHVAYTVDLLRDLGVRVLRRGDRFVIDGGGYHPVSDTVSAGSSGSTLYFTLGLACLADAPVTVTGQKYFRRRPVAPLLRALTEMGVHLDSADGCPPVRVRPGRPTGGTVHISGSLSQWISGLLLLAPFATGRTVIEIDDEPNERPYLKLTVDMMRQFGLTVAHSADWRRFEIEPDQQAVPTTVHLPPDLGSAAFGFATAALHPSDIVFQGLPSLHAADHPEAAVLDIVQRMGLRLTAGAEATVRARHDGSRLAPTTVDCRDIPDLLPVLSAMAAFADGTTVFENISHVRLKESDRASAMLQLNRMGADLELQGNRLVVHGVSTLHGADVSSFNDHRVLMSLAVAATRATGRTTLTYPNAYRISYPEFLEAMTTIGLDMAVLPGATTTAGRRPGPSPTRTSDVRRTPDQWVRRWATERPHDVALVDVRPGRMRSYTWQEIVERADRLASALLGLGVQPGERVAYQLPNWCEFVVVSLATMQIGAVCCPLMPIFRQREVSFALRRSAARVLVIPQEFRGRNYVTETAAMVAEAGLAGPDGAVAGLADGSVAGDDGDLLALQHVVVVPASDSDSGTAGPAEVAAPPWGGGSVVWHSYPELMAGAEVNADLLASRRPTAEMTAQLLFTSGTSGEPKGVLHRFEALTRAALMEAEHLGLSSRDSIYIPSPLAHQTGFLYGMWLALVLGSRQVIQGIWNGSHALRVLRETRCTFVQAATPFLADLVTAVGDGDRPPTDLRIFVATGAAVPRGLAERATRQLGTAVCGAWGTTETCLGTLSAPGDEPIKVWGTDGRPLRGIDVRITDDEGRILPAGTEGNFELRGPTFFTGYLDRPDWTAAALTDDGFFRTGDLGILDADGYIRISGRVKDVINRGGEKVPVAEIEQILYDHPAVQDVAIVAMPDDRLGERACAFVALRPHADLSFKGMQKLLDAHQVAKHYWPERLEVIDAMPRNAAGKIQKFVLRERARGLRPQTEEELDR